MHNDSEKIIEDKRLLALYGYWVSKRGNRAMPARADVDPAEIPMLLPIIILIDVVKSGSYRYRLVGTEIVRSADRDVTGKLIEEALSDGPYRQYLTGLMNESVSSREPLYAEGTFISEGQVERQVSRLVLPLSADGTAVDMILVGQTILASTKAAARIVRSDDLLFAEKRRLRLA